MLSFNDLLSLDSDFFMNFPLVFVVCSSVNSVDLLVVFTRGVLDGSLILMEGFRVCTPNYDVSVFFYTFVYFLQSDSVIILQMKKCRA